MTTLINTFDEQYAALHRRSLQLAGNIPPDKLFWQPGEPVNGLPIRSAGENLLRSAAAVEQTFGGITSRLWDDPFEWTLPEELATPGKVIEYLNEVEATRTRGFALFASDDDLRRDIAAPVAMKTVFALLLETLARAENLQGRAFAVFRLFFSDKSFNQVAETND